MLSDGGMCIHRGNGRGDLIELFQKIKVGVHTDCFEDQPSVIR